MSIKKSAVSPPINAFHKDKEIKKIISSTTPKKKRIQDLRVNLPREIK